VEGGRAEDAVQRMVERERREVRADEHNAPPEPRREVRARLFEHVTREVYCHDTAARQPLQQAGGDPARAAARVHHRLVTVKA
jgi:hypothetical protein